MEVAAGHSARILGRRVPQRDGHHQRSFPRRTRARRCTRADETLQSEARPARRPRPQHRTTRHRQIRKLHEVSGAGGARADRRCGPPRRADLRGDRLCRVPHPGAPDRPKQQSTVRTVAPYRCTPICYCTTSAPATVSSRRPRRATRFAPPALWGLRVRKPLLHDGSAATPADAVARHANEAGPAMARYHALTALERKTLLAFLASL